MTETWTITAPNRTPSQAAQEFCDSLFAGRKVAAVDGHWYDLAYRGTFQLLGGNRVYTLTCDRYGKYTITA
jgi:hypothetical protein